MKQLHRVAMLAGAIAVMLAASAVWAADALQAAEGKCELTGPGRGQRGKPVLGVITAIEGDLITIKPEVPAWLASKLRERGVSVPPLPESISFRVGGSTQAWQNSAESSPRAFRVGDRIAAGLDGDPRSGSANARRIADESTAQALAGKLEARGREHKARAERAGRPVLGTITAIEGNTVTIAPELPQFLLDKLAEHGRPVPQLPASLSFTVRADAEITRTTGSASLSDFMVGEQIGAMVTGEPHSGNGSATKLADYATAKAAVEAKLAEFKARRASGGFPRSFAPMSSVTARGPRGLAAAKDKPQGAGRGSGEGKGPGSAGRPPRPHFGVITQVDGSRITITPEVPEFIKDLRLEGGPGGAGRAGGPSGAGPRGEGGKGEGQGPDGGKGPRELPKELSAKLSSSTKYFQHDTAVSKNPFKVGDRVAIMPTEDSERGNVSAAAVSDYATAEARMKARMKEGGPGRGEGGGGGKDKPRD